MIVALWTSYGCLLVSKLAHTGQKVNDKKSSLKSVNFGPTPPSSHSLIILVTLK